MDPAIFILLLFLDCHLSRGQDRADASGTVTLRLNFDPYFNNYEKHCCKFYQAECQIFVNNRRYAADPYKGRISIIEYSGLMVVNIWNLQKSDAGVYRCAVFASPYHIYMDYPVQISDSANRQSPPRPSMTSTTSPTSVTTVTTSATPAESLDEFQSIGSSRFRTDMWITLAALLSVLMMLILVISITAIVVHHRKKDKKKSGTVPCDRSSSFLSGSTAQDVSTIVYTTVNFKTCEEPTGLYANLKIHKSAAARSPQTNDHQDSRDTVEYSTLAVRQ